MACNAEIKDIMTTGNFATVDTDAIVEGDIIVPDKKGDIAKILICESQVFITKCEVFEDKVNVTGNVCFHVLYISEENVICSLNPEMEFSKVVKIPGVGNEMIVLCDGSVLNTSFNIINGRKIGLRSNVGLKLKVFQHQTLKAVCGFESDVPIELKTQKIRTQHIIVSCEDMISLSDILEIPQGKPSIGEVLLVNYKIANSENRALNGKMVCKGDLVISTLYKGENNTIQFMEHSVPFTEILEVSGLTEEMAFTCKLSVNSITVNEQPDGDGDMRNVAVNARIKVYTQAQNVDENEMVSDAFAVSGKLSLKQQECSLSSIGDEFSKTLELKEILSLPNGSPSIMQVYDVMAKPRVTSIKTEDKKVIIEGLTVFDMLYLSDSEDSPLFSTKNQVEWREAVDIPQIRQDDKCEVSVAMDYINYNISLSGEVEVRANLQLLVKATESYHLRLIEDAELLEPEESAATQKPSLVIYFVQKNDTLWDIAKHYGVLQNKVMEANSLDGDNLSGVKKLIIPVA